MPMLRCNYTAAIYAKPIHSVSKCQPHVIPAQPAARVSLQPPPAIHLLFGRRRDSRVKAQKPPKTHKLSGQILFPQYLPLTRQHHRCRRRRRTAMVTYRKRDGAGTNGQATHRNGTRVEEQDTGFYHEYGQSPSIIDENVMRPCSLEECRHRPTTGGADHHRKDEPKSPPAVPLEAFNS